MLENNSIEYFKRYSNNNLKNELHDNQTKIGYKVLNLKISMQLCI